MMSWIDRKELAIILPILVSSVLLVSGILIKGQVGALLAIAAPTASLCGIVFLSIYLVPDA